MTEGHPCFVANNGRIGFGVDEYRAYAPEAGAPVRLIWLAAHRDHADVHRARRPRLRRAASRSELGADTRGPVRRHAGRRSGLDPADYLLIPVHPWQWWNRLAVTFAAEMAAAPIWCCLGDGAGRVPARSSRSARSSTSAEPDRHYVKTALSVLNMGFMRGLSAAYMEATPAINDWLAGLVAGDAVLAGTGLRRSCASGPPIGYRHRQYEAATDRVLPVPQDARRAVAGEPGARARRRASDWPPWPRCCTSTATGGSLRGRADRASRAWPRRSGCAATWTPTWRRCCTASTRTTWRSCRTARTSSWSSTDGAGRAGDLQGHRRGDRGDGPGRASCPPAVRADPRRRCPTT